MKITKWTGKPITKPGFYSGIPLERYHSANICAGPAISSSDLRACWKHSPAKMFARWAENPAREERKTTDAMLLGGVAHYLLLGEDDFKTKYITQPETYRDKVSGLAKPWHNGAGVCKEWNDKQRKAGRVVCTVAMLETVIRMAKSLALEPLVKEGLLRGDIECSGFVQDQETGLWIKVRPDVVPASGPDYVDLKTTTDVTSVPLMSTIRTYGYHQQGALVWEFCDQMNLPFETFVLMFVESEVPNCSRTVPLTDDDLARGRLQNRAMMRTIKGCMETGHWPGPGEGDIRPLPLSSDERDRIDARLKLEGLA